MKGGEVAVRNSSERRQKIVNGVSVISIVFDGKRAAALSSSFVDTQRDPLAQDERQKVKIGRPLIQR